MQPLKIEVSVNIGLTEELKTFLSMMLRHGAPTSTPKEQEKAETPATVINGAPIAEAQEEPTPVAEEAPPVKDYTEVDVREAMDKCRKRIEGEDYKENTASEGYKKWHKPLTAWFKNTAVALGADKPSALPDHESRAKFIEQCGEVIATEQGLSLLPPF